MPGTIQYSRMPQKSTNNMHLIFSGKRLVDYIKSYRTKQVIEASNDSTVNIPLCNCFQMYRQKVERPSSVDAKPSLPTEPHLSEPHKSILTDDSDESQPSQLTLTNPLPNPAESTVKFNFQNFSLPEVTLKRWFSEIIEALQNLHLENIYCFDLNPKNILLGPKGEILLSYFYKNIEQSSFHDVRIEPNSRHSSVYVAPERPLNAKSDWWSAGIIFFELYTGHAFECCHPSGALCYFEIQYPEGMEVDTNFDLLLHGVSSD